MPRENRLSIVWRMVFKSLGSSAGPRGTNCLKSMGCGAKSISDICLVGLRDREDVAELRAEEVECCEASSRKDNRTVGLKGRGVFSVSLPWTSVSCLLRLFEGEGVRTGRWFIAFGKRSARGYLLRFFPLCFRFAEFGNSISHRRTDWWSIAAYGICEWRLRVVDLIASKLRGVSAIT
jgi:hypothetical protein